MKKIAQSNSCKCSFVESEYVVDLAGAQTLFQDALTHILNEEEEALHYLRALIDSTIGIERLSVKMCKPTQTIKRMLSTSGNPTFHNLMAILSVIRKDLNVQIHITVVPPWKAREMEIERLATYNVCI